MPTLFVSYPREYRPVVERLVGHLRSSGYDPFFDEQLAGGQSWWDELLTRIESADVFMPIIGTQYLQSTPCQLEAQYATAWRKRILPVMIESVPSQLFMPSIATAHWVDYTPQRENAILDVIRAINLLPAATPPPDPRPERPKAPISYMTELQNEVQGTAEISRERQLVLIADLKSRLATGDKDAALMLLAILRARPDLYYQSATDIDDLLAANGVRPRSRRAAPDPMSTGNTFDLSSVETVVVPGSTIGHAVSAASVTASGPTAAGPTAARIPTTGANPVPGTPTTSGATTGATAVHPWVPATTGHPSHQQAVDSAPAIGQSGGWPAATAYDPSTAIPPAPYLSAQHPSAQHFSAPQTGPTLPPSPSPIPAPPNGYIPLGIVATIVCIPLGVIALIMASKANTAWRVGDQASAETYSKQAKGWAIAGLVVGVILILYVIGTNGLTTSA